MPDRTVAIVSEPTLAEAAAHLARRIASLVPGADPEDVGPAEIEEAGEILVELGRYEAVGEITDGEYFEYVRRELARHPERVRELVGEGDTDASAPGRFGTTHHVSRLLALARTLAAESSDPGLDALSTIYLADQWVRARQGVVGTVTDDMVRAALRDLHPYRTLIRQIGTCQECGDQVPSRMLTYCQPCAWQIVVDFVALRQNSGAPASPTAPFG